MVFKLPIEEKCLTLSAPFSGTLRMFPRESPFFFPTLQLTQPLRVEKRLKHGADVRRHTNQTPPGRSLLLEI